MIKLALIGSNGMLAQAVRKVTPPTWTLTGFDLPEFDLTDPVQVEGEMMRLQPDVIINCAAYTQVDQCETQEAMAMRVNGDGPGFLARVAKALNATLVHISTDYVFDGAKTEPYTEEDRPHPQSAYGRSKLAGEQAIIASGLEKYFIVRTSWLYGPGGKNFVETMVRLGREREELRVVADQIGCPTFAGDLAEAIFKLLALSGDATLVADCCPYGLYHFSNEGQCSWYEFAEAILAQARQVDEPIVARRVVPITTADYPLPAPRPAYSVFSKGKYQLMTGATVPAWQASLARYFKSRI